MQKNKNKKYRQSRRRTQPMGEGVFKERAASSMQLERPVSFHSKPCPSQVKQQVEPGDH